MLFFIEIIMVFIFNHMTYLIRDFKAHHLLFLQTKVQLFRQLLVEEAFKWCDEELAKYDDEDDE